MPKAGAAPAKGRRSSSTSSSDLSDLLSDSADPTMTALREKRLAELRASALTAQNTVAVNAPGYGIPTVVEEPLAIQTTADAASSLLLFSHADMAACARMRAHLDRISAAHTGIACVVVEAEKASWLAARMGVRVLPVLIGMLSGKEVGRIVGFEGLDRGMGATWRDVEAKVTKWGVASEQAKDDSEDETEEKDEGSNRRGKSIRVGGPRSKARTDDDDSDWD